RVPRPLCAIAAAHRSALPRAGRGVDARAGALVAAALRIHRAARRRLRRISLLYLPLRVDILRPAARGEQGGTDSDRARRVADLLPDVGSADVLAARVHLPDARGAGVHAAPLSPRAAHWAYARYRGRAARAGGSRRVPAQARHPRT